MSQLTPGPLRPQRPAAESDVYTALLGISALALLLATIFIVYRVVQAFGSVLPPPGS